VRQWHDALLQGQWSELHHHWREVPRRTSFLKDGGRVGQVSSLFYFLFFFNHLPAPPLTQLDKKREKERKKEME
jgi:hypothetical protein